ncbi:DUF2827 domain-containing protein [Burkholderia sp. FERM BP-3421]|uniref:DUF2827 family protein n=1 Tax=Burkholderia sp. FERM BP-3421 TaxID=1494466 RepID=UPI002362A330|nr:DUF2827 family protein [Burkholderia sp. FERM BP-3421]WDD90996.1 DUF2827 domain-containing protein [Burkholderia sp. FERM BP-3421]
MGISVVARAGQPAWDSGLVQHVVVLAKLLRKLPFVKDLMLFCNRDQARLLDDAQRATLGLMVLPPRDATNLVDFVIDMTGGLEAEWLDYLGALDKTRVLFHREAPGSSPFGGKLETLVAKRYDEIWVLPDDLPSLSMLMAWYRCAAHAVPPLWCAQRVAKDDRPDSDYAPGRSRRAASRSLRVAIFRSEAMQPEACAAAMLICELANAADPAVIDEMHVVNGIELGNGARGASFMQSLGLYHQDRICLHPEREFVGFMGRYADALVSHHDCYERIDVLLDALYAGYPLVHDRRWLIDVGYYYPDADFAEGAACLLEAAYHHDHLCDLYLRRTRAFLQRLDPETPRNCAAYAARLLQASGGRHGGAP